MRRRIVFRGRMVSLLCSSALVHVFSGTDELLLKVGRRLRLPGLNYIGRFIPRSTGRELVNLGRLSDGIDEIRSVRRSVWVLDKGLAARTEELIDILKSDPPEGVPISGTSDGTVRVLHLLTNSKPFTASGYTVRSHHVLKCQQDRKIEVQALTRLGYPVVVGKIPNGDEQIIDGVTYKRMLPTRIPFELRERENLAVDLTVREAREFRATAIHTTTGYPNARVAARAAKELGIPWVYEVRGELEATWLSRFPENSRNEVQASELYQLTYEQENKCMKAASAIVALSEVSKQRLVARGIAAEKITVIPNAFESTLWGRNYNKKSLREELDIPVSASLAGSVTSVVDYEGLDLVIKALPSLPKKWHVVIVGDGAALPTLKDLAADLQVENRMHFVGNQPTETIWKWYAALDVFVVPRIDSLVTRVVTPIKPLNALALGVPVVASDLPALREVTMNYAHFVESRSVPDWVSAIESAASTSRRPPAWLRQRSWEDNAKKYEKVFKAGG